MGSDKFEWKTSQQCPLRKVKVDVPIVVGAEDDTSASGGVGGFFHKVRANAVYRAKNQQFCLKNCTFDTASDNGMFFANGVTGYGTNANFFGQMNFVYVDTVYANAAPVKVYHVTNDAYERPMDKTTCNAAANGRAYLWSINGNFVSMPTGDKSTHMQIRKSVLKFPTSIVQSSGIKRSVATYEAPFLSIDKDGIHTIVRGQRREVEHVTNNDHVMFNSPNALRENTIYLLYTGGGSRQNGAYMTYVKLTIPTNSTLMSVGFATIVGLYLNEPTVELGDNATLSSVIVDASLFSSYCINSVIHVKGSGVELYDVTVRTNFDYDDHTHIDICAYSLLKVDGHDVYAENTWLWRGDHYDVSDMLEGYNLPDDFYERNTNPYGIIVNGDRFTAVCLMVEHQNYNPMVFHGNDALLIMTQGETAYRDNGMQSSHKGVNVNPFSDDEELNGQYLIVKGEKFEIHGGGIYNIYGTKYSLQEPAKYYAMTLQPDSLVIETVITGWANSNQQYYFKGSCGPNTMSEFETLYICNATGAQLCTNEQ